MYYSKDKRGVYILHTMEDISLNGDAYTTTETLFKACLRNGRRLSCAPFREDLGFLLHKGLLHLEGQRLYTTYNWRCEQSAAASLANILRAPNLDRPELPDKLIVNGVLLTGEQHFALFFSAILIFAEFRLHRFLHQAWFCAITRFLALRIAVKNGSIYMAMSIFPLRNILWRMSGGSWKRCMKRLAGCSMQGSCFRTWIIPQATR